MTTASQGTTQGHEWAVIEAGVLRRIEAPTGGTMAELEVMQKEVGGYIENFLTLPSPHRKGVTIAFWCNEEGRLRGLAPNVLVNDGHGRIFDIVGNVVITGAKGEDCIPLTAEELADIIVKVGPLHPVYPEVRYAPR